MMKIKVKFVCLGILVFTTLVLSHQFCLAEISLPKLISDGMVLQRDAEVRVWGWASPREQVDLAFEGRVLSTVADQEGNWEIFLPAQKAGGPYTFTFRGTNEVTVDDVLFGEVWLCSGQSNMELTVSRIIDAYPEIMENANNPNIRQFLVPDRFNFKAPQADLESGTWVPLSEQTVLDFAAVGYYFATFLYDRYRVPIGLINAALGGSPIESWIGEEGLRQFPDDYAEMVKYKSEALIDSIRKADQERAQAWQRTVDLEDPGMDGRNAVWASADWPGDESTEFQVPGFFTELTGAIRNGSYWLRKTVEVPESFLGKEVNLWLGRIVDQDFAFVNGTFVGTTGYQYPPRKYKIPAGVLKKGENSITVRVLSKSGRGGFIADKPYYLFTGSDTISLEGGWKLRMGAEMEALRGPTFIRWKPGGLYNAMIAPLEKYRIRGALWYQGESNAGRPDDYAEKLSVMLDGWRNGWGIGDFPFFIVQLPNFMKTTDQPVESSWARLRQEQLDCLDEKNTGLAVTIDLGEWNDVHPLNKKDVGYRLSLLARKLAYSEKHLVAESPVPGKARFGKEKVVIHMDHSGKGLKTLDGNPPGYFAISNDGETLRWAKAQIKGSKITVWHDEVANPTVVRYAWANNPDGANVYNSAGLPMTPFEVRM